MKDYYPVVYSCDDFPIAVLDSVDELRGFFNMPLKYVMYYLKNNICFDVNGKKCKVFLFKKEKQNQLILERKR